MRLRRSGSDRGSLPIAMVLVLASVSLTAVALPTAMTQIGATRSTVDRGDALHAATTGLQVGLAHLRAGTALGCGPLAGSVGGEAGTAYALTVTYTVADPTSSPDYRGSTVGSCPAPAGAAWAVLTSRGEAQGASTTTRTLRGVLPLAAAAPPAPTPTPSAGSTAPAPAPTATYGPEYDMSPHARKIHSWASTSRASVCIDAGSSAPAAGTVLKFRTCDFETIKDKAFKQFFYYRQNLSLATTGSILAGNPLCLDAGPNPAVNTVVKLEPCVERVPARQRWYYNNTYNLELGRDAGDGLSGLCINVQQPGTSGTGVVLGSGANCRSSTYNTKQTFGMSPSTGPGLAGSRPVDCTAEAGYPCDITQVFPHAGPMRCLDKYGTAPANMECVQHPDPMKVRWNQLWRLPRAPEGATGLTAPIYTRDSSGNTYCLTTGSGRFPSQEKCNPKSPTAAQRFTRYTNTGAYDTMYRVVDSKGRCMMHPLDYNTKDNPTTVFIWSGAIYNFKITFDACRTKATDPNDPERYNLPSLVKLQKWNAPAVLPTSLSGSPPTPSPSATPPTPTPTPSPSAGGGTPAPEATRVLYQIEL
ncbi:MAG TPA: ricin-type beta-trefoil lectin domain protein [Pilimelia sp.]|nr:ricin-type beta-trefoil lectin domain protein [Pilimelia sp.]